VRDIAATGHQLLGTLRVAGPAGSSSIGVCEVEILLALLLGVEPGRPPRELVQSILDGDRRLEELSA
jgi:hypothetical protein